MALTCRKEEPLELNLTPMIDVVFLLIIFLMIGARFTEDVRDIDLRLPAVAQADPSHSERPIRSVAVQRDGAIHLDGQVCTLPQLTNDLQRAKASNDDISVAVLGDAGVEFQHVASVLAACKTAGIRDLAITVEIKTR